MKTKKSFTFNKLYLFAFLIPAVIMLVIFAIREIYPFGDRSFLHIDMYHQYFPFLVEFYHKLKNGESLFYSWNTGIGSNFLALYVYYLASPTNWLVIFCPEGHLMEFITYMVVIKTGLCGTTFAVYLKKHFHTDTWAILFFSTFYALSGYMAAYSWNVMWLDCIMLAPIIILALEKLVEQGNGRLYCMMLALSILSNYYLSIMICIFLVLYFIVLLAGRNPHNQDISRPLAVPIPARLQNYYVKAIIRFGVYSLLAGGIAAILLLPEVAALKFTEFSDINFPKTVKSYFSVIDMLARHCFNVTVETGLDHWPNIYCGVAAFLLLPLYIMQKKIPIREKAPKLILLAFILISYSTNVLNFIWHGLNYPDSLPARQSFLYIFLLLAMCFEAFLHIREHSGNEIMGLFLGVLAFILLCEKLITDDSFTGACFLFTGIFLICYAGLIHGYRLHQNASQILAILTFALVIAESGANMYLTSVSTVSRSTYLANYDSYQTLTKRTMEEEDGDFFRFEKFARRTQNDAMLIGFPSASYFSSTSNALVKDFYEKYGMKSSRVYYCYDGATPITAALLANRYMLYTIDRGYDTLFSLADTEGKLYLYRNNYSLPLGFMISSDMVSSSDMATITAHHNALTGAAYDSLQPQSSDDSLEELFSSADDVEENMHEDDTVSYVDQLNPIERQNYLVNTLGIQEDVFLPVTVEQDGGRATVDVETSAHLYAYTSNTKIDNIKLRYGSEDKTFKTIKKKYILDLGYHEAGSYLTLTSENGEDLNLVVYSVDEDVLGKFTDKLSQQTMTVDSYDETHMNGHITVTTPGELVLSIPYEPGWTLLVDGKEAAIDLFEDTMISTYLTEGERTIALSYYPEGFNAGILITVISLVIFTGLWILIQKQNRK